MAVALESSWVLHLLHRWRVHNRRLPGRLNGSRWHYHGLSALISLTQNVAQWWWVWRCGCCWFVAAVVVLFWCGGKVVHKNTTRLLKLGRKKLRCVDWAAQSAELWRPDYAVGDLCATGTYQLSRPVQRGEVIDYFVAWFAIVNPVISHVILLMVQKSGVHHLTCMKACKQWHIDHIKWCRISSSRAR